MARARARAATTPGSRPATAPAPTDRWSSGAGASPCPCSRAGHLPYENEGGRIELGTDGRAQAVREEEVCFSLALPRLPAPAEGWPLVIYGHGTGASFRYPIESGLAAELAAGSIDEGQAVPLAMLGYDGVLHGSRRGASQRSTEELVYNFANPAAARGNTLQGAADLFALARALPALAARGLPLRAAGRGPLRPLPGWHGRGAGRRPRAALRGRRAVGHGRRADPGPAGQEQAGADRAPVPLPAGRRRAGGRRPPRAGPPADVLRRRRSPEPRQPDRLRLFPPAPPPARLRVPGPVHARRDPAPLRPRRRAAGAPPRERGSGPRGPRPHRWCRRRCGPTSRPAAAR